jgi:hypothetical protein
MIESRTYITNISLHAMHFMEFLHTQDAHKLLHNLSPLIPNIILTGFVPLSFVM